MAEIEMSGGESEKVLIRSEINFIFYPVYSRLVRPTLSVSLFFLCPFAVYYLRYAVTSFFTMSRTFLADSKTAGQKVHRKIAGAVQNVKTPLF
jgi:hypothetical protein